MLRLMDKINEGYFREKIFFATSWTHYQKFGFFIKYLIQIGFGLDLISLGLNFQIFHAKVP